MTYKKEKISLSLGREEIFIFEGQTRLSLPIPSLET